MPRVSVTATGYDEEEKRQLKEAVESLGGEYNGGLVTETTHLVAPADADNSNKYISAVERGLHIVSPWWLLESASAGRWLEEGPFSGVFRGVVMAATGFAADDRTALRRAVAAGGGRFSEQLVRGRDADADAARFHAQRVTHLVACAPEGPKFEAAKEWGIPVVKVDWVRACARGGSYQPPQHFGFSRKEEGERRAWNSTTIAALPNSAVFAGCRICLVGFDDDDDDDDDNSSSRKSHGSTYGGGGGRGGGSGSAHVQEQQQQGNSSSGGDGGSCGSSGIPGGSGRAGVPLCRATRLLRKGMGTRSFALARNGRAPHQDPSLCGVTHVVVGSGSAVWVSSDEVTMNGSNSHNESSSSSKEEKSRGETFLSTSSLSSASSLSSSPTPPSFSLSHRRLAIDALDVKTRKLLSQRRNHLRVVSREWLRRCVETRKLQKAAPFEVSFAQATITSAITAAALATPASSSAAAASAPTPAVVGLGAMRSASTVQARGAAAATTTVAERRRRQCAADHEAPTATTTTTTTSAAAGDTLPPELTSSSSSSSLVRSSSSSLDRSSSTGRVFAHRAFVVDKDKAQANLRSELVRHGAAVYFADDLPADIEARLLRSADADTAKGSTSSNSSSGGGDGGDGQKKRRGTTVYGITRDGPGVEVFYESLAQQFNGGNDNGGGGGGGVEVQRASWFWVECVLRERTFCKPAIFPRLFTPQLRPIKLFPGASTGTGAGGDDQSKNMNKSLPPHQPLARFVVSVSVYDGPERSAIMQLVRTMGGKFESGLKRRVTHLVCRRPEGDKYRKCKEWGSGGGGGGGDAAGIKIVTAAWLYHCAREGHSPGCEDAFLVDNDQPPAGNSYSTSSSGRRRQKRRNDDGIDVSSSSSSSLSLTAPLPSLHDDQSHDGGGTADRGSSSRPFERPRPAIQQAAVLEERRSGQHHQQQHNSGGGGSGWYMAGSSANSSGDDAGGSDDGDDGDDGGSVMGGYYYDDAEDDAERDAARMAALKPKRGRSTIPVATETSATGGLGAVGGCAAPRKKGRLVHIERGGAQLQGTSSAHAGNHNGGRESNSQGFCESQVVTYAS